LRKKVNSISFRQGLSNNYGYINNFGIYVYPINIRRYSVENLYISLWLQNELRRWKFFPLKLEILRVYNNLLTIRVLILNRLYFRLTQFFFFFKKFFFFFVYKAGAFIKLYRLQKFFAGLNQGASYKNDEKFKWGIIFKIVQKIMKHRWSEYFAGISLYVKHYHIIYKSFILLTKFIFRLFSCFDVFFFFSKTSFFNCFIFLKNFTCLNYFIAKTKKITTLGDRDLLKNTHYAISLANKGVYLQKRKFLDYAKKLFVNKELFDLVYKKKKRFFFSLNSSNSKKVRVLQLKKHVRPKVYCKKNLQVLIGLRQNARLVFFYFRSLFHCMFFNRVARLKSYIEGYARFNFKRDAQLKIFIMNYKFEPKFKEDNILTTIAGENSSRLFSLDLSVRYQENYLHKILFNIVRNTKYLSILRLLPYWKMNHKNTFNFKVLNYNKMFLNNIWLDTRLAKFATTNFCDTVSFLRGKRLNQLLQKHKKKCFFYTGNFSLVSNNFLFEILSHLLTRVKLKNRVLMFLMNRNIVYSNNILKTIMYTKFVSLYFNLFSKKKLFSSVYPVAINKDKANGVLADINFFIKRHAQAALHHFLSVRNFNLSYLMHVEPENYVKTTDYFIKQKFTKVKLVKYKNLKKNLRYLLIGLYFGSASIFNEAFCRVFAKVAKRRQKNFLKFFEKKLSVILHDTFLNLTTVGFHIRIRGRNSNSDRRNTKWMRFGAPVKEQTMTSKINYSFRSVRTTIGVFGVSLWLVYAQEEIANPRENKI
jgi:hypothetical protein